MAEVEYERMNMIGGWCNVMRVGNGTESLKTEKLFMVFGESRSSRT